MRIDPNVCQKILVAVEGDPKAGTVQDVNVTIDGYEPNIIGQHIHYLVEKGMLKGITATNLLSPHPEYIITDLTSDGREYLDSLETPSEVPPKNFGF